MGEIVANGRFELTGTPAQNAILKPIWTPGSASFIRFPWALMDDLPRYPVTIGWENLNDGTLRVSEEHDDLQPVHPHAHGEDGTGHGISRPAPDGRLAIAGVFWTDGRIKIDTSLETRPDVAREVCSAELAHAVDYGLPITDTQKTEIMKLLHGDAADDHSWWEKQSYGSEYFTLAGEAFMALFTLAYSEMIPWQDPFTHKSTKELAAKLPGILGTAPAIKLTARSWRTIFGNGRVELAWTGAAGANVKVLRNGRYALTTANDGKLLSNLKKQQGVFTYSIVDADGRNSNVASVTV